MTWHVAVPLLLSVGYVQVLSTSRRSTEARDKVD
jgi:hypothetical protein